MAVEIAGVYMDRSLNAFQQACEWYIENEQEKLAPDNDLIALLCDAVRLTREMTAMVERDDARLRLRLDQLLRSPEGRA